LQRSNRAPLHHLANLHDGSIDVLDHAARQIARRQAAIILVGAIGEHLGCRAQTGALSAADHFAPCQRKQDQSGIDVAHCVDDGIGQRCVLRGHVIERPVRLDVIQRTAERACKAGEGSDLIDHHRIGFGRRYSHCTPPEALQVRQPGMCTDPHSFPQRGADHSLHGRRITGVEAAGDIRRCHVIQ
jgi:hypothetical protein